MLRRGGPGSGLREPRRKAALRSTLATRCSLLALPLPAVSVLGEAVDGWDAVETELRAAAGKPIQELNSVLVATQVGGGVPQTARGVAASEF